MERHIRHCHPLKDGLVEGAVIAFAMDFECHLVEVVLQLAELVFPPLRHIPAAVLEAAPKPQEVCTLQWRLSADAFPHCSPPFSRSCAPRAQALVPQI